MLQAEEEAIHANHFILNEEGDCLQANPTWLQHLQVTYKVCHTLAGKRTSSAYLFTLHEAQSTSRHAPAWSPV